MHTKATKTMTQLFVHAGESAKLYTQNKSGFVLSCSLPVLNFRCCKKSGGRNSLFLIEFHCELLTVSRSCGWMVYQTTSCFREERDTHTIAEQLTNICFRQAKKYLEYFFLFEWLMPLNRFYTTCWLVWFGWNCYSASLDLVNQLFMYWIN